MHICKGGKDMRKNSSDLIENFRKWNSATIRQVIERRKEMVMNQLMAKMERKEDRSKKNGEEEET